VTAKKPRAKSRPKRKAVASAAGLKNVHVVRGLQYAEAVVSGQIAACKWVRLACQRQLRDLARWRSGEDAWPFKFDEELGGRAAEFFEQLPHTQGPLAFRHPDGEWNLLKLQPWQCFIITTVYGWIRKDSPAHRPVRRFQRVYEEVPRSNGKSFKLSGGLLYSFAEGEEGVESYSAAVDRAQAKKVYGEAEAMLLKRPQLGEALGLQVSSVAIFQPSTNGRAVALSREAKKSGDGANIYFAAVDELHAHPTRAVWDVLDTGTGKRGGGALIWIITTAGFNTAGICYEKRQYVQKVLEGVVQDETWFGIIYTAVDPGEDEDLWKDEVCRSSCSDHSHPACRWRMANPNWGISVDPIDFQAKADRALQVASEQNNFLTKHLNIWCSADVSWMDMTAWDACADAGLREEDFAHQACVDGLDLASKVDICCKAKLFFRDLPVTPSPTDCGRRSPDGGRYCSKAKGHADPCPFDVPGAAAPWPLTRPTLERNYYLFVDSFLPEGAISSSPNSQYDGWVREGRILTTPGDVLDFEAIKASVRSDHDRFDLREVAFDPWQATQLSNELQAEAVVMVEVRPTVQNFSAPMKEVEALVLQHRLHHDGNPVMRWMVSNVVAHRDAKDNIFPRKAAEQNKIDGPVATIMALGRAMLAPATPPKSYLESQDVVLLG
jgi:phage terminase large subunit-like protein